MSNDGEYERIDGSSRFDGAIRESHEYRYKLAGKYTRDTDVVIDAACGTGYGKKFLKGTYVGVDKFPGHVCANLEEWNPVFDYDVFVSFETIEHVWDNSLLIQNMKRAKRIIAVSAPIVPTVVYKPDGSIDFSKHHVHDFTMDSLKEIFVDENWEIIYEEIQNNIKGTPTYGILILQRK